MNIAFYSGRSAMTAQQQGMNIHANNVANVNTVGFKTMRPSFAECIYVRYRETEQRWDTGHGQYMMKTDLMWREGQFVTSDQPLDFALPNDGFFMVQNRNGDLFLTRDGAFAISQNDDNVWELVSSAGDFVLDYDMNRIPVPFEVAQDADGNPVTTSMIDYALLENAIGVFAVANNWGLEMTGTNRFVTTARSGDAVAVPEFDKVRMALERSTTDLAEEMVKIIETQRAYQLSARIIQTADEFARIANNLRQG